VSVGPCLVEHLIVRRSNDRGNSPGKLADVELHFAGDSGGAEACLIASVRVASCRRISQAPSDAQLFDQSRTLRIKQLLGLACAMANLDLAAPSAAILPKLRFSCLFAGL
jgi:hypothetical protein